LASNISNDNLEHLLPAFNISQMRDKLYCRFWKSANQSCLWRHTSGVAPILREI